MFRTPIVQGQVSTRKLQAAGREPVEEGGVLSPGNGGGCLKGAGRGDGDFRSTYRVKWLVAYLAFGPLSTTLLPTTDPALR